MHSLRITVALAAALLGSCAEHYEPAPGWLGRLAEQPPPEPGANWPVLPQEANEVLAGEVQLVSMEPTAAGTTNAFKAEVRIDGAPLTVKWKPVRDEGCDSFNNTPRKEIAAFQVQRWFLDPQDYTVPPVRMHCLPVEEVQRFDEGAEPQVDGTDCVLGAVSLWLDDLTVPEELWTPRRFYRDPVYAWHMANLNLFTYVVRHRDGAPPNLPVSADPDNPRVYAIDNGMSFGGAIHNIFAKNWDELEVPALRAEAIERLRAVGEQEIEALSEVTLLVKRGDTIVEVPTGTEVPEGTWSRSLGLDDRERGAITTRIEELLQRVDAGEIRTF